MKSQLKFHDRGLQARMAVSFMVLGILYLAFLSLVSFYFGLGILPMAIIAGLMIMSQWYFSDKIVLWSTGAKIASREEYPVLHEIVENLASRENLPRPKIAVIKTDIPNAFATGKGPRSSVVAVTTGLMRILEREELEGVIAHELSHVKHRDVTVITLASLFSTIAWFIMHSTMYSSMYGYGYRGRQQGGGILLIFIVAAIVWFLSFLIIRAISRYREFAADRSAAFMTGKPKQLARALMKISGQIKVTPKQALKEIEGMNAFFIIPAASGETIANLFSTHPPVEERIKRLLDIEATMRSGQPSL
jgi:heat shock protein HtpX